jgi:hypothetical protein
MERDARRRTNCPLLRRHQELTSRDKKVQNRSKQASLELLIIGSALSELGRRHNGAATEGAKLGFCGEIFFKI